LITNDAAAGDDLDELLSELSAAESDESLPALVLDEVEDAALTSLEIEVAKDAAYAAQEAAAELAVKTNKVVATEKPKEKSAKKAAKPNTGSTATLLKSAAVRHKLGEACYEVCILDTQMAALTGSDLKAAVDQVIDGTDQLPKKVGEKVLNLLCAVNGKDNLSVYTKIAIDLLKEKGDAGMTALDLRQKYLERPYSSGTSSAQSSQMFQLLPYLGIATRSGQTMTISKDSVLADLL